MVQRRFVNFGADANASGIKAIVSVLSGPQLLRAPDPFLLASAPDTLIVQPHACCLDSGIVIDETEQQTFTVPTGAASADYTLQYQHVDEDVIGGTAATLSVQSGLTRTVADGIALGWIRYPGGSVPLSNEMLFPARPGQLRPGTETLERVATTQQVVVQNVNATVTSEAGGLLSGTIPTAPYQLAFPQHLSRLLPYADQRVRCYDHAANAELARIDSGTPTTGQFRVDSAIATFAAADTGHAIDLVDMTYGGGVTSVQNSLAGASVVVETLYGFGLATEPLRALTAEYVALTAGYQVGLVEALDATGEAIDTVSSVTGPTTPDGTSGRLVCRLLSGVRSGTGGGFVTVRLRQTVPASGSGLLLRVRATSYDEPF